MSRSRPYLCQTTEDLRRVAALNGIDPCKFEMLLPRRCAHWNGCSRRDCPLDPLQILRDIPWEAGDGDEKCHALLTTRQGIIAKARAEGLLFDLHYDGMTTDEWKREKRREKGRKQWQRLPAAQKQARLDALAERRRRQGGCQTPASASKGAKPEAKTTTNASAPRQNALVFERGQPQRTRRADSGASPTCGLVCGIPAVVIRWPSRQEAQGP